MIKQYKHWYAHTHQFNLQTLSQSFDTVHISYILASIYLNRMCAALETWCPNIRFGGGLLAISAIVISCPACRGACGISPILFVQVSFRELADQFITLYPSWKSMMNSSLVISLTWLWGLIMLVWFLLHTLSCLLMRYLPAIHIAVQYFHFEFHAFCLTYQLMQHFLHNPSETLLRPGPWLRYTIHPLFITLS